MKKLLLVLLICVVIDSGKEVYRAGSIIITEVSEFSLNLNKREKQVRSDKQIVFNILLLPNECHCP
jgi:hypothetical protein